MNRIRQYNGNFQVLVTPSYNTTPSMEIMLGNWVDEKLHDFRVVEFSTMNDAMALAFSFPDIDWNKLVNIHKDVFLKINDIIKKILRENNFTVEFDPVVLTPKELKNTMFDRVMSRGARFSLFYNVNDVICFNIINPWSANLSKIASILNTIPELRIHKTTKSKTSIKLLGVTDVGTTYEIRLWTSIISQWARWIQSNNLKPALYADTLQNLLEEQKRIDANSVAF